MKNNLNLTGETMDEIIYTVSVEEHLSSLPLPDPKELVQKPELIDAHLDHITSILQSTAQAKIPVKKFHW